jgi:dehydrogenase/reductase SDR family member 12
VARITETLLTPRTPQEAFDHVADFTTSADWDPSIATARRLDGGDLGVGARFEVRLQLGPRTAPLVYEITAYERPHRVVLVTRGRVHRGRDDVRFRAVEGGTEVTWDATFELRGPGVLLDPLLARGFRRAGAAAVEGLARSLDGEVASR